MGGKRNVLSEMWKRGKGIGFWCLPLMYFIKIISVTAGGDSILREIFLVTLTAASQTTATDSPKTTCDDHQQLLIELKHNELNSTKNHSFRII